MVFIATCNSLSYSKKISFDNNNFTIEFYSDATGDNGNSFICRDHSKTGVKFWYRLCPGFAYPYAGISLTPSDSSLMDLHTYKYIDVRLSADTTCAVNIYLKTWEDAITIPEDYITYRFLEKTVWISKEPQWYRIELSSFSTPQWWIELHKMDNLPEPDLKKVHNFDIATNIKLLEREGYIQIHEFVLKKDGVVNSYFFVFFMVAVSAAVLLFFFLYRKFKSDSPVKIISYKQQETSSKIPSEEERVLSYIGMYYAEPGFCLNLVATECGVNSARAALIIKNRYNLTFKQYINTIKIEEAKRLLRETSRQILDIALSVGYGDASHFNRTFKLSEGCSPREFRATQGRTMQNQNTA